MLRVCNATQAWHAHGNLWALQLKDATEMLSLSHARDPMGSFISKRHRGSTATKKQAKGLHICSCSQVHGLASWSADASAVLQEASNAPTCSYR